MKMPGRPEPHEIPELCREWLAENGWSLIVDPHQNVVYDHPDSEHIYLPEYMEGIYVALNWPELLPANLPDV